MNSTFDFKLISVSMEMDAEDILHLMNLYQGEIQKDLRELEQELETINWKAVKNKLHKMKGDAANLCLDSLADAFAQMERYASTNDSVALTRHLDLIRDMDKMLWTAFHDYYGKEG